MFEIKNEYGVWENIKDILKVCPRFQICIQNTLDKMF